MFEYSSILMLLIALPLIGIILLLFIPNTESNLQKSVGLSVSLLTFFISILLWLKFDMSTSKYQFVEKFFSGWREYEIVGIFFWLGRDLAS